jgi:hypothetical protein
MPSIADADAFVWDGHGVLMDWRTPAAVAAIYLVACSVHNSRLQSVKSAPAASPIVDAIAITHNVVLVVFSAVMCAGSTYHFAELLRRIGLRTFLCPPLPVGGTTHDLLPLGGPLHWWCYVFYLSKYYELVDTALLIARGKRIIPLHAIHHAFIPYVMCVLFDGRVSISLVSMSMLNALVHVVMYSYYLASALGLSTPLGWKQAITQLQITQFLMGVIGGTWYWFDYVRAPRLHARWPVLEFTEGCGGGKPMTVLVGYVMNCVLLVLFVRFYLSAYRKKLHGPGYSSHTHAGHRSTRQMQEHVQEHRD